MLNCYFYFWSLFLWPRPHLLTPLVTVVKSAKSSVDLHVLIISSKELKLWLKNIGTIEISSISTSTVSYMICIFIVQYELCSYNDSCRVESFNTLEWNVSWRRSSYLKISMLHMVLLNQWICRKYSYCWNSTKYELLFCAQMYCLSSLMSIWIIVCIKYIDYKYNLYLTCNFSPSSNKIILNFLN